MKYTNLAIEKDLDEELTKWVTNHDHFNAASHAFKLAVAEYLLNKQNKTLFKGSK